MAVKYKEYTPETYKESDQLVQAGKDMNYWNKQNLQDFQYDDFKVSDEYTNMNNQLNSLVKPGDFSYSQQQGMNDIWNQIQNREKFSYDVNGDALYQQYKDQYVTGGKMAMMDTMGQAAAMTGGYGNSYAQSVGQQAYQGYLQQLTDKIPELYSLAMSKYQMEGDDLLTKYGLHTDQYNREYGQHRDSVADYNTERGYLADRVDSIYNRDLGMYTTNRDTELAEVESRNNNISSNRSYYTDVYNTMKNTEWGQHMDNETLKKLAIDVANDNLYKNEQSRIADDQLEEEQRQFNAKYDDDEDDDVDDDPVDAFTGKTYQQAVDYIKKNGGKGAEGLRTQQEFLREKRLSGGVSIGGQTFTNYADYLKEYVEWAVS